MNGVLLLPDAPLLVASRPIVHTNYAGPIRGTLITARFLDPMEFRRLSNITRLSLSAFRFDEPQLPRDVGEGHAHLSPAEPVYIRAIDKKLIHGYILVNDFLVIIQERITLPMRGTAHLAGMVGIVETGKETVKIRFLVPPHYGVCRRVFR